MEMAAWFFSDSFVHVFKSMFLLTRDDRSCDIYERDDKDYSGMIDFVLCMCKPFLEILTKLQRIPYEA